MKDGQSLIEDKKLHVFISDDDADDIGFFERALKEVSKDIKITIAKDGLELLEFMQLVVPDIIFLDINMPRMNGIECLAQIRKRKIFDKVPVIIYSTTAKASDIDHTYKLGANLYLQKPVTFDNIRSKLYETLSMSLRDLVPQPPRDRYYLNLAKMNTA